MTPRHVTLLCAAVAVAIAGCQPKLPEQESYAGQLYVKRCGNCHVPYNPQALTTAMWQKQLEMMDSKIRQAGLNPLTEDERKTIVDYLARHSNSG